MCLRHSLSRQRPKLSKSGLPHLFRSFSVGRVISGHSLTDFELFSEAGEFFECRIMVARTIYGPSFLRRGLDSIVVGVTASTFFFEGTSTIHANKLHAGSALQWPRYVGATLVVLRTHSDSGW